SRDVLWPCVGSRRRLSGNFAGYLRDHNRDPKHPPPSPPLPSLKFAASSKLRARLHDAGAAVPRTALWASLGLPLVFASPAPGQNVVSSGDVTPSPATSPIWNIGGSLTVGQSGTGTLTVEAGGKVSNSTGYLGYHAHLARYEAILPTTGTATITGSGSHECTSGIRAASFVASSCIIPISK